MEAGVNVLIEKPIGITVRAAKSIISCAEKTGKLLHVAENYRMDINERALHWAIKKGCIGTPRILNWLDVGERKWYWDWRDHLDISGGAWTFDGGVHHSDLFQYNLGGIKRVTAVMNTYDNIRYAKYESISDYEQAKLDKRYAHFRKTRSLKPIDPSTLEEPIEATVEDTTAAILEFDSGVIGTWLVSRAAPGKVDRSNVIYGSEGAMFWGDGIYDSRQQQIYTRESLSKAFMESLSADEKEVFFPHGVMDTLAIEWKQHFDAVNGIRPVEITAEVGLNAMAIPMAIYESAVTGQPVLVEDVLNLKIEKYQEQINKLCFV
jgi:predicted dehydrogenase